MSLLERHNGFKSIHIPEARHVAKTSADYERKIGQLEKLEEAYKCLRPALGRIALYQVSLIMDSFILNRCEQSQNNNQDSNEGTYSSYIHRFWERRKKFIDLEAIRQIKSHETQAASETYSKKDLDNARRAIQRLILRCERWQYYLENKAVIDSNVPNFKSEIASITLAVKNTDDQNDRNELKKKKLKVQTKFRALVPAAFRNPDRFRKHTSGKLKEIYQKLQELNPEDPRRHLFLAMSNQLELELRQLDIEPETQIIRVKELMIENTFNELARSSADGVSRQVIDTGSSDNKNGQVKIGEVYESAHNGFYRKQESYEGYEQKRREEEAEEAKRRIFGFTNRSKSTPLLDRASALTASPSNYPNHQVYIWGSVPVDVSKKFTNFGVPASELFSKNRAVALELLRQRHIELAKDYFPRTHESLDPQEFLYRQSKMTQANVLKDFLDAFVQNNWKA